MNRLLKVYLLNIFKQKGFYICLFINLLFTVLLPYVAELFVKSAAIPVADRIIQLVDVGLIAMIYITIFVCSDYTDGAAKNFISRGYTRRQVLYAKFIASLIAVFSFFALNAIVTFAVFFDNGMKFDKSKIIILIGSLIASVAAIGFYVITSNTIEKLSTAITVNVIVYSLVPAAFLLIMTISKIDFDISNYWITGISGLIPKENAGITDLLKVIGITTGYLVLLFELSNYIIKKKEVK